MPNVLSLECIKPEFQQWNDHCVTMCTVSNLSLGRWFLPKFLKKSRVRPLGVQFCMDAHKARLEFVCHGKFRLQTSNPEDSWMSTDWCPLKSNLEDILLLFRTRNIHPLSEISHHHEHEPVKISMSWSCWVSLIFAISRDRIACMCTAKNLNPNIIFAVSERTPRFAGYHVTGNLSLKSGVETHHL